MNDLDEQFLWQMIELAWKKAEQAAGPGVPADMSIRKAILVRAVPRIDHAMQPFATALSEVLTRSLTKDGFLHFVKAYEAQIFALDREDLAKHVGLGDDGFMDARAFIVAMGQEHFEAVRTNPKEALVGVGIERVYWTISSAYERRFGEPYPDFGVSLSTGTNLDGWPKRRAKAGRDARIKRIGDDLFADLFCDVGLHGTGGPLGHLARIPAVTTTELEDVLLHVAARVRARRDGQGV